MLSKVDEAMCLIGRWTFTSEQCEDATRLMNASLEQGRAEGAEELEKRNSDAFNKLIDDHDTAFAAGKTEGEEQERERIRTLAMPVDDFLHQMSLIIPLSAFNDPTFVLAPKEKP